LNNAEIENILGKSAQFAGLMDIRGEKIGELRQRVAKATGISIKNLEEIIVPMENIYALCDHTRCLAYMLGDLIVPSNIREGYLARLVLRRSIRMMQKAKIDEDLENLVVAQMEDIGLNKFEQKTSIVREIIQREVEKYDQTIERGSRIVQRLSQSYIKRREPIPLSELITLYDSHGIPIDLIRNTLTESGAQFEIPDDFDSQVADMHSENEGVKPESPFAKYADHLEKLPATVKSYYDHPNRMEGKGTILDIIDDTYVVLNSTICYPDGGGQPCDLGFFSSHAGITKILDVVKYGDIILHKVENNGLKRGDMVKINLDEERRRTLMRHHSGTHMIIRAAKEVLGPHIHQAGSQLATDIARLDIKHYTHITQEEMHAIERKANELVMKNLPVEIEFRPRVEAEQEFGFALYQGGVPPGKDLRIVKFGPEIEACAGTHCISSGEIGPIKLLHLEHIQDGIERIEFACGFSALNAMQNIQLLLNTSAETLSVQTENLPATVNRFFTEWKDQRKEIERLRAKISKLELSKLEGITVNGVEVVVKEIDISKKELISIGAAVAERGGIAVLITNTDSIGVVIASGEEKVHADKLIGDVCAVLGGKGGGKPNLAQGSGTDATKIGEACAKAEELIKGLL
ncbi:MAG TPA: alanine--tRNA ligase-related protein, partial [Methanocorpusculum sp.]|nr:alanine--tRNA ligase-related protein [Methanocorpusculum sp.]